MTDSITNLPDEFKTAIEIVSLCTSIPIYVVLSIKRVLLSGEVEPNTQNLLQKGRPFILRREAYSALIDEAHKYHMRVWAHDRVAEVAKSLIRAGIDAFAHEIDDIGVSPEYLKSNNRSPGADPELLAMLRERGPKIFMTLTQPSFPGAEADRFKGPDPLLIETVPPKILAGMRAKALATLTPAARLRAKEHWATRTLVTQELIATGIRIGVGSDSDHIGTNIGSEDDWGYLLGLNMIGWGEHAEMEEMVASGMTPTQVIVAGTKTNAEWLGLDDLG